MLLYDGSIRAEGLPGKSNRAQPSVLIGGSQPRIFLIADGEGVYDEAGYFRQQEH